MAKVGRKYFAVTLDGKYPFEFEFHLDSWQQKTNGYSVTQALYESEQEWLDEQESHSLTEKIRKAFDCWGSRQFELKTLRGIVALLEGQA